MRLADLLVEPMALVLALAGGRCSLPPEEARPRVDALLARFGSEALETGYAPKEAEDALFAFCAWADETVLGSAWPGRAAWEARPLQRALFQTLKAGEEFHQRLAALLSRAGAGFHSFPGLDRADAGQTVLSLSQAVADFETGPGGEYDEDLEGFRDRPGGPDDFSEDGQGYRVREQSREALEVFALCLSLGFTGRYYRPEERTWLRGIAASSAQAALSREEARPEPGTRLFPEAAAPGPVRTRRRLFWRGVSGLDLFLIFFPVLGTAFLYYAYNFLLGAYLRGFLGVHP
jgi:type VI secretion system protein ImpK